MKSERVMSVGGRGSSLIARAREGRTTAAV